MRNLRAELDERRARGLYRRRLTTEGPHGPETIVEGRRVLAFCSNDYLGLANHPKVIETFKRASDAYGVGSGAAHLVNGHSRAHQALEEDLATFTGRARALLFSTGYMANLGVAQALVGRGDAVFEDRLNHASLLDAGLLSGARFTRYRHADADALETRLSRRSAGEKLILTDGVFSMDGDVTPLPALAKLAARHDAWLMVDDAHGLGVLGENGRGTLEHFDLGENDVPVLMGTLGKALGAFGAFVAGSEDLIETLIQHARTYIYTTAPPPAVAAATRSTLQLAQDESWRRHKLHALIARFRTGARELGLPLSESTTPIQPLIIGEASATLRLSQSLWNEGLLVTAIRPPTVPKDTARLRITLSAAHSEAHVERLLDTLAKSLAGSLPTNGQED